MLSIVEELRTNRESGARRLEAEYKAGLMTIARRLCADEGDAEELVNSTFADVIEGIDDYLEQSAFFGWMCKILENRFAKEKRRKSNQTVVADGEAVNVAVDEDGAERIFQGVDAALLRDAIDGLPDEMKEALMLRYFMGLPVARVAKLLSVPEGTAKWRLHCARMILAAKLGAAAKKPGGKALLIALALAALSAIGAAVVTAVGDARNTPPAPAGGTPLSEGGYGAQDSSPLREGAVAEGDWGSTAADTQGQSVANTSTPPFPHSSTPTLLHAAPGEQNMNAQTATATMVAAATLATTASAAASDLPRLDSARFDYKYEMVVRPDLQDLDAGGANDFTGWSPAFSLGTGQDVGTIKIDASSNGKYLVSNQAVGTVGDGWRSMAASSSTGFTVEARLKITDCTGANGAICVEAGPSDSKVYARLNFFADSIGWNGTTLKNLDTSAWHTYRIARAGGTAVHSVWVDGELVAEDLGTGFTYNTSTLYRMLLGSPGSGWTGKAEVAWLRYHKGAYAPPVADDKSRHKASVDFPVKYEMAAEDSRISTTGNASDWTISGQAGATIAKNGFLSVVPNGEQTYWRTTDSVWKDRVTGDTAFTVEVAAKIRSCTIANGDRTLQLWVASPRATGNLIIGMNHVYWQLTSSMGDNILLDSSDNTDRKHVFRIAYDGATRHGFTVWRDGVKLGEILVDLTAYNGASFSFVRFGIPGSTSGGAFDIDYIRWDTTGAWEWKDPPKGFVMVVR